MKLFFFKSSSKKSVVGSTNAENLGNESRMLYRELIADLIMLEIWYVLKMLCILEWSTVKQLTTDLERLVLWLERKSGEFIDLLGEGLLL